MHGRSLTRVVLAMAAGSLLGGCGGGSGAGPRPTPPALGQDYASNFVGDWMGAATAQVGAQPETVHFTQTIARASDNLLTLKDFCTTGSDAWGVVTGATTFTIPPLSCKLAESCGVVTLTVDEGSGVRAQGQLTITVKGTASGCGQQLPYAMSFQGATTLPPTPVIRYGSASVNPGQSVTLDGSGSFDTAGSLQYSWQVLSGPAGAAPTLSGATAPQATFSSAIPGTYVVQLTVTGPDGQIAATTASIQVKDWTDYGPPSLSPLQLSATTGVPSPLQITAYDPNGLPLRYAWSLISGPPGRSPTLTGSDSATPMLTAYVDGYYDLQVVVTNYLGESAHATVTVVASPILALPALAHQVVHAGYSRALDRIVMTDPSGGLWLYDPTTANEVKVSLGSAPSCLSLSRDGQRALVGHDGSLSLVDLATFTATPIAVSVAPDACALGDGWAYLFPANGTTIDSVDLANGVEHLTASAGPPYLGPVLSPDGHTLYAIQYGAYVTAWDVTAGTAAQLGSVYVNPSLRGLWLDGDGSHLFTSAPKEYGLSVTPSFAVDFVGSFQDLYWVQHLDVSSAEIAAIPGSEEPPLGDDHGAGLLELYNPTTLTLRWKIPLPLWLGSDGRARGTYGRYVFYSADGSKKYVVAEGDAALGLQNNVTILTY